MNNFEIKDGVLYSYKGDEEIVEIPEGVKEILYDAFVCCQNIKRVIVPESVYEICGNAFYGCSKLENVVIKNKEAEVSGFAFNNCPLLGGYMIRDNILIRYGGKPGNNEPESITIPEGITGIGEGAFKGNHLLKEVIIPEGVTVIGAGAFGNCSQLDKTQSFI